MITVGICAYNEGKSIAKALNAILPQLGRKDELIVVASGCTDNTEEIVRGIAKRHSQVKLVSQKERRGKPAAINTILGKAKGKIIVLTDADVIVEKSAIKKIVEGLGEKSARGMSGRFGGKIVEGEIGAVVGKTVPLKIGNFFDRLQEFAWQRMHELRAEQARDGELFALNGYLSAVRSGIVSRIDENSFVDDWTLGWEIKRRGWKIAYEPKAVVKVKAVQGFGEFIAQKSRNRIGQMQLIGKGAKIEYVRKPGLVWQLFLNPYALAFAILDGIAWLVAVLNYKNADIKWKEIHSSKLG